EVRDLQRCCTDLRCKTEQEGEQAKSKHIHGRSPFVLQSPCGRILNSRISSRGDRMPRYSNAGGANSSKLATLQEWWVTPKNPAMYPCVGWEPSAEPPRTSSRCPSTPGTQVARPLPSLPRMTIRVWRYGSS